MAVWLLCYVKFPEESSMEKIAGDDWIFSYCELKVYILDELPLLLCVSDSRQLQECHYGHPMDLKQAMVPFMDGHSHCSFQ